MEQIKLECGCGASIEVKFQANKWDRDWTEAQVKEWSKIHKSCKGLAPELPDEKK